MISILIPIYNQDITKLVCDLQECIKKVEYPVEIRCYEDGSSEVYSNAELQNDPHVVYIHRSENVGRGKIRNILAQDAQYPNLLFLDGDSGITDAYFLSRYIENIDKDIVCGGRCYTEDPPALPYLLHWTYGRTYEVRTIRERIQHASLYFHSNNFLIKKYLTLQYPFEKEATYGYEDLVFAYHLERQGFKITHIENQTLHLGLDTSTSFINKVYAANISLKKYVQQGLLSETKLTRTVGILEKTYLAKPIRAILKLGLPSILSNLQGSKPRAYLVNFLKLYHFLTLS